MAEKQKGKTITAKQTHVCSHACLFALSVKALALGIRNSFYSLVPFAFNNFQPQIGIN